MNLPECMDCLTYVFFSSAPTALQTHTTFTLVISGAQKNRSDVFVIFSEFSLACLQTLALTNPLMSDCVRVCMTCVLCVCKGLHFSFNSSLVLRSPSLVLCVNTACSHFAPAVAHLRQRRGFSLIAK